MSDWASTERIRAEIILADQARLEGELHVQGRVGLHDGPETVLEMLNRDEIFFPLTLAETQVAFVAKSQVSVVVCASEIGVTDPELIGALKIIDLEVTMAGGAEFRGHATIELPPSRARALDYLNTGGRFFALRNDSATRFINRAHVRVVRPLD